MSSLGDSHGDVLAELLSLKSTEGTAAFNLNSKNYEGKIVFFIKLLIMMILKRGFL